MTGPITVALVEDDLAMRERLARVIRAEPTLALIHLAANAKEIMAWFDRNAVDVLLVDLGLPDRPGLDVIAHCASRHETAVMVLTMFGDQANMLRAFRAGARGYLLKDGTEDVLATHVLALHSGGSPMSPIIARQLLERWEASAPLRGRDAGHPVGPAPAQESLSPRELQVLDLIARGFTYSEIAARLQVHISTVCSHIRNIYGKLGVHNKAEAVFEARQAGWLR